MLDCCLLVRVVVVDVGVVAGVGAGVCAGVGAGARACVEHDCVFVCVRVCARACVVVGDDNLNQVSMLLWFQFQVILGRKKQSPLS